MFDNYPQPDDYMPDNRVGRCACMKSGEDTITVGGTTSHVFTLDFSYSESCRAFRVIYTGGLEVRHVVDSGDDAPSFTIEESGGKTYIRVTLDPSVTKLFSPSRDAMAQMRLTMMDGSVVFGAVNALRVIGTLPAQDAIPQGGGTTYEEATMGDLEPLV